MTTILDLSAQIIQGYTEKKLKIATAESCTGGLISAALTETPGASLVLDRSFVTYSNASKVQMLGVSEETIAKFGAVSRECVIEMAKGALLRSEAEIVLSVSGIAGPAAEGTDKPVGLLFFGLAIKGHTKIHSFKRNFKGDRMEIRVAALKAGLEFLASRLKYDNQSSFSDAETKEEERNRAENLIEGASEETAKGATEVVIENAAEPTSPASDNAEAPAETN